MRIGKTIIVIDVPIPAEIAPLRFAPPRKTETEKERDRSPRTPPTQVPIPVSVPTEPEKVDR